MSINNSIKKCRLLKKLTQKQMSELLNINIRTYQKYESGDIKPNMDTLHKIASALDVPIFMLTESISPELLSIFIEDMHYLDKNTVLNNAAKLTSEYDIKNKREENFELLEELLQGFKQLENNFNKFKENYIVGIEEYINACKENE